jgi:hypothetical protein
VDHGTVALVLIVSWQMFLLPLYQVLEDRLAPHLETVGLEVAETAILIANVDLSLIFYDLTAFVRHGC